MLFPFLLRGLWVVGAMRMGMQGYVGGVRRNVYDAAQ